MPILIAFIEAAMHEAKYKILEDGTFFGEICVFRPHPDTHSGNIRTVFRNYPDSISVYPDTLSNY